MRVEASLHRAVSLDYLVWEQKRGGVLPTQPEQSLSGSRSSGDIRRGQALDSLS